MSQETSFSTIPDAPSLPESHTSFISSHPLPEKQTDDPPDPNQVPLRLSLPKSITDFYPTLYLDPYHINKQGTPSNVLALINNAAKREVADLVSILIPALETNPIHTNPSSSPFGDSFREWWRVLLRFFFFVAETNDEIIKLIVAPVFKYLTKKGDVKTLNNLQKQRKSITDRYEFTMEIVFRAADKALAELNLDNTDKVVDKLHTLVKFILKTVDLVMNFAEDLERIAPELNISGLEYVIADKLATFAKEDKPVMVFICARWMNDDEYIRPWIIKYGGMWSRIMYKSWQATYQEQRAQVVDGLAELLDPTNKPENSLS